MPALRHEGRRQVPRPRVAARGSGAPVLDGILAWIDCDIESVTDAGDHYFVLGRVRDLAVVHDGAPCCSSGGYGRFAV